jgi:rsbT co-antagonist protein RsbR
MSGSQNVLLSLIDRHHQRLLTTWLAGLKRDARRGDAQREAEVAELAKRFLEQLRRGAASGGLDDIGTAEWAPMREMLEDMSRDRAIQGYSPSETAAVVVSAQPG